MLERVLLHFFKSPPSLGRVSTDLAMAVRYQSAQDIAVKRRISIPLGFVYTPVVVSGAVFLSWTLSGNR